MPYNRTVWENNKTPLNADNMNNIEDGIVEAKESSENARVSASNALTRANQAYQHVQNVSNQASQSIVQAKEELQKTVTEIKDSYIKSIKYDSKYGIFTIVDQNGEETPIDLAIEKVVANFTYDKTAEELVLTLADGSEQRIAMSSLVVDGYTKVEANATFAPKATESNVNNLITKVTDIEAAYIKNVTYDKNTGVFIFTLQNGSVKTVDLAIEKVVTNFVYDSNTKSLVLTLADGTTQSIPLTDFIKDYTGKDGDQIQINITNHEVSAILKESSININHLNSKFASDVNAVFTAVGDLKTNLSGLQDRVISLEQNQSSGGGSTSAAITEEITVSSSSWVALNNADVAPYTYSTNLQPANLTEDSLSIELINNQPVLFAKHGFAIMYVSDGMVELYSIGKPTSDVTLVFEIYKTLSVYTGSYTEE
jgi:hypothetical protein